MTNEEKALEIIEAIASMVSEEGGAITISRDLDYGTGTLTDELGCHTHIGSPGLEGKAAFESFMNGLHGQLVRGTGLSWYRPEE